MNTADTLVGGCLCGAVRYRIEGRPEFVMQCFCRDCQKATGTGHTTIVGVEADNLVVDGTPTVFTVKGEPGGNVTRHFCGKCGGRLFTPADLESSLRMVQAGSLDDPNPVTPVAAVYLEDAAHWDKVDPSLKRAKQSITAWVAGQH
ncbi:MAG TPA: GFA family protein [Steroidobacteraceae bacterium]